MKKVDDFETVYDMIEHAIELAFDGKMQLKFYEFLKYRKTKKEEVFMCCDSPNIVEESGCETCKVCGWSLCHVA